MREEPLHAVGGAGAPHAALLPQRRRTGSSCKLGTAQNWRPTPPPLPPNVLFFSPQDLLTSALLSEDAHKAAYHLPRRGADSPLQVRSQLALTPFCSIFFRMGWGGEKTKKKKPDRFFYVGLVSLPQQLGSWEQEKCGKAEEHVLAAEQSHKYLNTYSTRTLVM